MSYLSMMEARLPPGFRFHPRDDELICDYLARKMAGNGGPHDCPMIVDVDLNKCEPWDLPETACVGGKEWYFFNLRDRKYTTGLRTNRATASGYWKATGKDRPVSRKGVLVGMRKTLVFYQGRAPKGNKTDWVMHEFRLQLSPHPSNFVSNFKEDWVLCRVSFKCRAAITKTDTEICQYDKISSCFPSLKHAHMPFDQMLLGLEVYEQVPCFSNLSARGAAAPPVGSQDPGFYDNNKFLKDSSFNHFTKLDGYSKKEHPFPDATQGNLESFLGENGMSSHIWSA